MEIDNHRSSYKKRKRRSYAIRIPKAVCHNTKPETQENKFWSVHKQHDWVIEMEFKQN